MIKGMPFHQLMESLKRKVGGPLAEPDTDLRWRTTYLIGHNGKIYFAPQTENKKRRSFFLGRYLGK